MKKVGCLVCIIAFILLFGVSCMCCSNGDIETNDNDDYEVEETTYPDFNPTVVYDNSDLCTVTITDFNWVTGEYTVEIINNTSYELELYETTTVTDDKVALECDLWVSTIASGATKYSTFMIYDGEYYYGPDYTNYTIDIDCFYNNDDYSVYDEYSFAIYLDSTQLLSE